MKEEASAADGSKTIEEDPEIEMLDYSSLITVEKEEENLLFPELDAYWFLLGPEFRIYRFIYIDEVIIEDERIEYTERFRPILLIHGFKSDFSTWNWLAQRLWADGFRNIFAMELFSYTSGLPILFEQLTFAIDYIISILPEYKFITLIGHSLGGMIARYYLKQEVSQQQKVRLCATLGSPHYGVLSIFAAFTNIVLAITKSFLPSKMELIKDFSPKGRMVKINETIMAEDLYTTTMVNIMGSLQKLGGTDGLFKPKPIHDMVNLKIAANHFQVNKVESSYCPIRDLLLNQAKVFKLRLLYIHVPHIDDFKGKRIHEKEYFFRISSENKQWQRYPLSGYVAVRDQSLIPKEPLVIYTGMSYNPEYEEITIEIYQKDILLDFKIFEQNVTIKFGSEKHVDCVTLTIPTDKTTFAIAYVSYMLKHTYIHSFGQ